jgi:NAD(P)-dependent dehydrogenase (short-subunit alcohol dehydrogenase family)
MAEDEIACRGHEIVAEIPMGRVGTAREVAQVILFLASPMGDYLNGATVDVNGGSYVR